MTDKYRALVLPRLEEVRTWAAAGASRREIAARLGISPASLSRYRRRDPVLAAALAGGAAPEGTETQDPPFHGPAPVYEGDSQPDPAGADLLVENALLKRACGYEYEEVVTEEKYSKELGEIVTFTKVTRKHMQPDPTSIQFWLTNRCRDRWAQRPEPEQPEDREGTGVILLPEVERPADDSAQGGTPGEGEFISPEREAADAPDKRSDAERQTLGEA